MNVDPLDGFDAVFTVHVDRGTAWARLTASGPADRSAVRPGEGQCWLPAFEDVGDVIEAVPGERLRARKANAPCAGTEVIVVLEDAATGTRVTVTQSGFGDIGAARPWLAAGWATIVADLAIALERGIELRRHLTPWGDLGCAVEEVPGGVVVRSEPRVGSLAAAVPLRPDDLVVAIAGAPVTCVADLAVLCRSVLLTGATIQVDFVRGSERRLATGIP